MNNIHNSKKTISRSSIYIFTLTILLTSCLPFNLTPSTATPLPTDTALPTSTIIWFPATATPTPKVFATYTATPEMNPGIGEVILTDDFSNGDTWDTAISDQGSATITHNRLALSAQPGVYISSLRRDMTLTNFYAEVTAHPSLCRGDDTYGIIIRAQGNSFYRFGLTCNSMVYAERVKSNVRLSLQAPIPSGDAPPGAPSETRISIWAVGGEMRLFLNGRFQFSISDISFSNGAFGLFARGAGDTPVSVTFSDLVINDVSYSPSVTPP